MLNQQLQAQAVALAKKCQYDWNEPETIELIKPHLDQIKFLFENIQNLKVSENIAELFCRVGTYYLHELRQPENAKQFLYGIVRYVDFNHMPYLWQELNNHLAFYHQQLSFRYNNQKNNLEAKKELLQSNEFCLKIVNAASVTPKKFDALRLAFTKCVMALNSGEERNYVDAHGHYNEAFRIYDEFVPEDKIDNQSLRAKARDAQFLIELGRYSEALAQFKEIIERWRLLGSKISTHPYAFRTFLAYAKSLMQLAQRGFKVNLEEAKAYAQEAYDIQRAKVDNENHPSLKEAKDILAGIANIDPEFMVEDLVDYLHMPAVISTESAAELLVKLSKFNRDNLTGNFEEFYNLISQLKAEVQQYFDKQDIVTCFKIFKQLAVAHTHAAKFESGIYYFKAALIAKENDVQNKISDEMLSDVYQTLGTTLVRLERFEEGKQYAEKALKLREPLIDKFELPKGYNAYWHTTLSFGGNVLYGLNAFTPEEKQARIASVEAAIAAFENIQNLISNNKTQLMNEIRAAQIEVSSYQSITNDPSLTSEAYVLVLQQKQNELLVLEGQLSAYERVQTYLPFQIAEGYLMLGNYYLEQYAINRGNKELLNLAFVNLSKSSTLYKTEFKVPPIDYSRLLNKLAFYHLVQDEFASAEHQFKEAEKFVLQILKLPTHHLCETYLGLQLVYEKMNKPELAIEYANKYADSRQEIYGEYVEKGQLETYMRKCFMGNELSNENHLMQTPQVVM